MKQVWTNDGHEYDWFNPAQAEGRWLLQHATQVKNILGAVRGIIAGTV